MLWYYTTVMKLQQILADGEIRPAVAGGRKEKPAVWFSANQDWDPAANMDWQDPSGAVFRLNKDQTYTLGGGLARIGVAAEAAACDWKTFKEQSGISPSAAKDLYNMAVSSGSRPGQWFASFECVPASKWLAVEILEGVQWVARSG